MSINQKNGILKCQGFYRGKVIQHLNYGKCKIFVPSVYPSELEDKPEMLPDAEQASPLFGGTNNGNGMFSYPNIGTIVWVFFENENQNRPVYFAATLGGEIANEQQNEGFMAVRDNVQPNDDPTKDTTKNGEDSQQHMINCGDSRITIRESGQIDIKCEDEKEKTKSRIFMDKTGSIQIEASQSIQLTTPAMTINAQDQLEINTTTMVIRANNELQINTPQFASVNSNSFTVKSPAINMDAKQGKFMAFGGLSNPLFVW